MIADRQNVVMISIATFWELSIKTRLGKMEDPGSIVFQEALDNGFTIIDIEKRHLEMIDAFEARPGHKDPFDHLILVHAMAEDATLITSDAHMRHYPVKSIGPRVRP